MAWAVDLGVEISENVLNEGHEMKTIEETMSIIYQENNHRKINTLEVIKILKVASSENLLNDVIAGQNDPIYKLLPSSVIFNSKINSPGQATNKNSKF